MTIRKFYSFDWVSAIRNSLEKVVNEHFPQELHSWPLLKTFDFDAYIWNKNNVIFILRDKIAGVVRGPGTLKFLDNSDTPKEAPSKKNISEWLDYLQNRFSLRPQDAAIIIPLMDSGKKVEDDWALWSEIDKQLWHQQIDSIVTRQFYYRKGINIREDFYIPPGYKFLAEECVLFFRDHPNYERNVFIMTRFVPGNNLLEKLDREIRSVLRSYSLESVRSDDKMYMRDRNLWNNVCVYMICCKYGIAILEDRVSDEFNPNVALEYGFMRALNKPTLLLADSGFRNLRADIIGTLREHFDITNIEGTIKKPIEKWLKELGVLNI